MKRGAVVVFHILPIAAALLAWVGDLLLGYVQPGAQGLFGMAQRGWIEVAYWRPLWSMAFAAVAFPLFLPGIYAACRQMARVSPGAARVFLVLAALAGMGGLFIHAFFCVPQVIHRYLSQAGLESWALPLTDRVYAVLTPAIGVALALYALALGWLLFVVSTGRTPYPRGWAAANPLVVALVTVPLWLTHRFSPHLYALMLSTPNLGMLLFFLVTAADQRRVRRQQIALPRLGL